MTTLIAAIDDSAAALPVLEVAQRIAALLGVDVEALHVPEDGSGSTATAVAAAVGVPLHTRSSEAGVVTTVVAEARDRDAIAVIIGARGLPAGATPAGHVALELLQSLKRPVVVVPPNAVDRPLHRVLVAVEGDGESHALRALFDRIGETATPEVIALHVLEPKDLPPFADSPVLEAEAYEREFLMRTAGPVVADPARVRLEMRVGNAPDALRDAAHELDVDLVVLAWHCDLSKGHGRLVREMLEGGLVPVALFPLRPIAAQGAAQGAA
ncbi:MAG TPA: universal stress protein [Acidimicrobiia bacterium]